MKNETSYKMQQKTVLHFIDKVLQITEAIILAQINWACINRIHFN